MKKYNIKFDFDGKEYEVDGSAYDSQYIVLPDSRAIRPNGWFESLPPQLAGASEHLHLFKNLTPEQVAKNLGSAVIAWEVKKK